MASIAGRSASGWGGGMTGRLVVRRILSTEDRLVPAVLRIALGLIVFPHGAQHALGWFGGYGFMATHQWMTETLGFPAGLAALAIVVELAAPVALVLGFAGRVAAMGIGGLMLVAATTHLEHGFFMNWFGALPAGAEGFEYHLLAIAIAFAVAVEGSGASSVDRSLAAKVDH